MRIGSIGNTYQIYTGSSYVRRNNAVSSSSLDKINAIPNDALAGKTEYEPKNENPLAHGETKGYQGIMDMQFTLGRNHAASLGLL